VLGHAVFDLTDFRVYAPVVSKLELIKGIKGWLQNSGASSGLVLVQCRQRLDQKQELEMLQNVGFQFRELTQHPILQKESSEKSYSRQYGSLFQSQEIVDVHELHGIACEYMNSFEIGRLQGDSRISREQVSSRFYSWLMDTHQGHNRKLISITDLSGNKVGIFLIRSGDDGKIFWELTALESKVTSRGLAKQIFGFMAAQSLQTGHTIETNFSSENIKLFKVYLDLGFRLRTPSVAMHLWLDD
jgi:hypothetical protein